MIAFRPLFVSAILGASGLSRAEETPAQTPPVEPRPDAPMATDLPAAPPAPSPNVTINLINRLVQKGILKPAEADELIKQAEADAATATQNAAAAAAAALPPPPGPDDMRVTYIPEVVRNNMRDQIKQELMAQAHAEKWSDKPAAEWTSKFRP